VPGALWDGVTIDKYATFNTRTGEATISGTVSCNTPTFCRCDRELFLARRELYSFSSPGGWGHSRYVGTSADAAVAGSITIGSSDLLSGSTYSYATLYTANSGSVTLHRW